MICSEAVCPHTYGWC